MRQAGQGVSIHRICDARINHTTASETTPQTPRPQVIGWKRLVARYDRDPDLLLVALLTGPARLVWSVLRGRRKLADVDRKSVV